MVEKSVLINLENTINKKFKKKAGRTVLSKKLKASLLEKYGAKCFIYNEKLPENELQIDHRVPFEVAGDSDG